MDEQIDSTANLEQPDPIEERCAQFKQEWESGLEPKIREFLNETPIECQPQLLDALLQLEFSLRKDNGEDISLEELAGSFSEFRNLISTRSPSLKNTRTLDQAHRTSKSDFPAAIGNYHIESEVARGGMGIVLKARDPAIGRNLAIKVGQFSKDDESNLARFLNEARITGQLQHPGVPPVHEIGSLEDGRPFFAMKLIEGTTLSSQLRNRLDLAGDLTRMLLVFRKICETVAYAHAQGIVHRDLKPDNVMVGAFGEVQVMDWGLAKSLDVAVDGDETMSVERRSDELELNKTIDGAVMGTPSYMAPEQARGDIADVDKQSDVFGLGAILCQILTGKPPFIGNNAREVIQLAARGDCTDAIDRLENSALDETLIRLTKRCLTGEKSNRPQDADEVARCIGDYQNDVAAQAREAEVEKAQSEVRFAEMRKRSRLRLTLIAAVSALILVAVVAYSGYQQMEAARLADELRLEQELTARRERIDAAVTQSLESVENIHSNLVKGLKDPLRGYQLLSDLGSWKRQVADERSFVTRAEKVANSDPGILPEPTMVRLNAAIATVARDEAHLDVALKLDKVIAERFSFEGMKARKDQDDFQRAFKDNGIDLLELSESDLAALGRQINQRELKYVWLDAIDSWLGHHPGPVITGKLQVLAKSLGQDPLLERLLQWHLLGRKDAIARQVQTIDTTKHSPMTLTFACRIMWRNGLDSTQLFEKALLTYPNNYRLNNELVASIKDPKSRAIAMRNLVIIRPDSAVSWRNLGWALTLAGDIESGISAVRKALEIEPEYSTAWHDLGSMLSHTASTIGEAEQALRKAIKLGYDSPVVYYSLGSTLYEKREFAAAIEALLPFAKSAGNESAWLLIGNCHLELKQLQQARNAYQKVLELAEESESDATNLAVNFDAHGYSGKIAPYPVTAKLGLAKILIEERKIVQAMKLAEEARKLHPDNSRAWYVLARFYRIARKSIPLLRLREIEALRKTVELDPSFALAWAELGTLIGSGGQHKDAIEALQKSLEINADNAEAWANLGLALMATNRFDEGKSALDRGFELKPSLEREYWTNLANGSAINRKWKTAETAFEKVLEFNEKDINAVGRLLMIYNMVVNCDKRVELITRTLKHHPTNKALRHNLEVAKRDRYVLDLAKSNPPKFASLPADQRLRGEFLLGKIAINAGDRTKALKFADKIYEDDKSEAYALLDAARLYAACLENLMNEREWDKQTEEKLVQNVISAIQASRSMGWEASEFQAARFDLDLHIMQSRKRFREAIAR